MSISRLPSPGAGIPTSTVTAKGDLIAGTANNAVSRLGVGANGTTLVADSAETTGLKWATPAAGGGMTLITTSTADNTFGTVTFSSISGSYKHLCIIGQGLQSSSSGGTGISLRFNNDTGSNYTAWNNGTDGLSGTANGTSANVGGLLAVTGDTSSRFSNTVIWIYDYATSGVYHPFFIQSMGTPNASSFIFFAGGQYNSTSAITRVDLIVTGSNNYKAGTLRLYGVN